MEKVLESVDVWFTTFHGPFCVNASPNEAMALMAMPCMSGLVERLVPCYGLSSVPVTENKE